MRERSTVVTANKVFIFHGSRYA
eukprot:COSAG03_NODE_28103_length_229_cov_4.800000_1_plen_22_part_10